MPDVLHRREHRGERQLDVGRRAPRCRARAAARASAAASRRGTSAARIERRRLLLDLRVGQRLDAVLRREVVELVRGTPRLDQVRGDHRVLGRKLRQPRQRLVVVRDDLRVAQPRRRARRARRRRRRRRPARARSGRRRSRARRGPSTLSRQLALAPRHRRPGDDPLARRHGLVELVDAVQQVAELEAPEHLAQLASGRAARARAADGSQSMSRSRRIVASSFDEARLVGELDHVLLARRRELVRVRDHLLDRAVLRDQLPGGLVADAGDAGDVVGGVALQPDEVRNLLGLDAVARLDALGRVDLHVADAARRHHQRDVVGDELERVAVGRDDGRLDARLVGARRERRDHVVRLPALELEVAVAERLDDRAEVRELLARAGRPSAGGLPCRRRRPPRRSRAGARAACPRRRRRPSACSRRAA